jgi:aldehyde dehydrogenase (NAD+)
MGEPPYGLSGSVWSQDRHRTGTIGVSGFWYGPDVPFEGYEQSGIGREMGVAGFEEYTQIESLAEPA